jgi:hypothetical protein
MSTPCGTFALQGRAFVPSSRRPARRGCFREASHEQGGIGVLRVCLCTQTLGRRPRTPALPPLRVGRANALMRDRSAPPAVHRVEVSSRRARSQQSPPWSAERRASYVIGREACVHACGPTLLAREGCLASTRAPIGAPPPRIERAGQSKARRRMRLARRMTYVWTIHAANDTRYFSLADSRAVASLR